MRLHKTVGVKVGRVQVGGGAPVVVQSMTLTDTADAGARRAVHRARRSRIGDGAGDRQPARSRGRRAGDQAADARRRLHGAAHRRLPLQRSPAHRNSRPAPARSTSTASTRATSAPAGAATSSSPPSARSRSTSKPVRIGVNGGSLNQELVVARMQENTDRDLGKSSEEIINECMVLSAIESTALAIESGLRKGSDHHLVQDLAAARSDRRLPGAARARRISRCISRPDRAGMGAEGLVWSASAIERPACRGDLATRSASR